METVVHPPEEILGLNGAGITAAWARFAEAETAEGSAI
jgi:hypothetical protein